MRVIVPFAAHDPKTRLSAVLDNADRSAFARLLLEDVLSALRDAGREPTVLSTARIDVDASVEVDDRPLTPAVNAMLAEVEGPVGIVMADLGLLTPDAVERVLGATGDVVLAPGRAGGTNVVGCRHPTFRVDYHGASFLDHLGAARTVGADVRVVDSFRLATDIDEPADLIELLIHGEGRAADWLRERGFGLDRASGRVGLVPPDR